MYVMFLWMTVWHYIAELYLNFNLIFSSNFHILLVSFGRVPFRIFPIHARIWPSRLWPVRPLTAFRGCLRKMHAMGVIALPSRFVVRLPVLRWHAQWPTPSCLSSNKGKDPLSSAFLTLNAPRERERSRERERERERESKKEEETLIFFFLAFLDFLAFLLFKELLAF